MQSTPTSADRRDSDSAQGAPALDRAELELGPARITVLRFPAPVSGNALPAVARPVPGGWRLVLVSDGPLVLRSRRGTARLAPGDLVLWDAAEPFAAAAPMGCGAASRATALHLPRCALPVSVGTLDDLAARPVPADSVAAALLAQLLEEFASRAVEVAPSQAGWLGRAAVDLALAFLTGLSCSRVTGAAGARLAAVEPRQAALLRDIKAYIDGHLVDAALSPLLIARAHHVSVRYLHHLFRQDDSTVGGYLRVQRLERCRADLADPSSADRSVSGICARWGFCDATVFSRAFKRQYGLTPSEYRKHHARLRHDAPAAHLPARSSAGGDRLSGPDSRPLRSENWAVHEHR
ncbi:helix-turn-helix domain-containing protein [Streptomyces sp. ISL-11]|uniref:helix-turn-helix domain-containing protein n=1 Tax=Streptomyces sp. ISL-11 TaxID=2819174 RepID=UPI001BE804FF|nr:helix-turn-helix domain-containing protein [Streptomyces sp. ISL-11]MBT2387697.1 helix-turn-helix domain-containing protein [Streptomyces sp. ISL-11]